MKQDSKPRHQQLVGRNNMKFFALFAGAMLSLLVSNTASANASKSVSNKTIDMKCYVELIGGEHTIHRNYEVPIRLKKRYKKRLMDRTLTIVGRDAQKPIYKVKECKEMNKQFKDEQARALEKLQQDMG